MRRRLWLCALAVGAVGQVVELGGQTVPDLDALADRWLATPAGSEDEAALEDTISALVEDLFGQYLIERFHAYLAAPVGSTEESEAISEVLDSLIALGVDAEPGRRILEVYSQFGAVGTAAGMPGLREGELVTVDLSLSSTQASALAASRVSIIGTLINHSDGPVWIVDRYTTLLPPPEVFTRGSGGSLVAFFPSIPVVPTDEVVRIDPNGSYRFIWTLDPRQPHFNPSDTVEVSLANWLQFRPGLYPFTSQVHVWSTPPDIASNANVSNLSASQVISAETQIEIGLPIIILVVGGAIGGAFGYLFRLLSRLQRGETPRRGWVIYVVSGFSGAVLIAAMGTILVSRLGAIDSFVSLNINDVWGAVASGFVLERVGIGALLERATT